MNPLMNIGEAAKAAGVSPKMVRHYEQTGLLPPAERTESGYRLYGEREVSVLRFIRMLPAGRVSERDVAEFNEQQMQDMVQIRDFLILHYKVTNRRDSPFWRHCAAMPIPDTLAQKIELFRETGRVFRKNEELFAENSWVQVMMGQGIEPQSWHPIAEKLSPDELDRFMAGLRESVARTAATLPDHHAYVARYCGAPEPRAA